MAVRSPPGDSVVSTEFVVASYTVTVPAELPTKTWLPSGVKTTDSAPANVSEVVTVSAVVSMTETVPLPALVT